MAEYPTRWIVSTGGQLQGHNDPAVMSAGSLDLRDLCGFSKLRRWEDKRFDGTRGSFVRCPFFSDVFADVF